MLNQRFFACLTFVLTMLIAALSGCNAHPEKNTPAMENVQPTAYPSNGTGSFNLQKRHGLGGWSGPARPSEAALLNDMKTINGSNVKALPKTDSPKTSD
jgi:hypothetical protein